MSAPVDARASRARSLEMLLRIVCFAYPRDFRDALLDDMASSFAREAARVRARHGRAASLAYAVTTLVGAAYGTLPARLHGVAPPRLQMDVMLQDVRFALRSLFKSPAFTAVAAASLALGIGANAAIFSVVNVVLLGGLPYPDADRLVVVWERNESLGIERTGPSGATFIDWRERSESFEDIALFDPGSATITDLAEPQQVPGMRVTVNFFDLLGYEPALGRDFRADEARGGRHDVLIFSHGFWQRGLGGDPDVLGRELMGDHIPYTVIGVLPPEFWYPLRTDLFVPWDEDELRAMPRYAREYAALGRLRPDVTLAQAQREMDAIAAQLEAEDPDMEGWGVELGLANEEGTAFVRPALLVLLGAVAFVLLISCANVANLLLARASSRRREIAVRAATGASRGRLVRQLLTESLLLAVFGGIGGVAVGVLGVRALRLLLPGEFPLPGGNAMILMPEFGVDGTVLLFTAATALLTGVLFGIVPAWQTSLVDVSGELRRAGRGVGGDRRSGGLRNALVAAEIALAVVLLVGATLMIQTFWNLSRVDVGFEPAGLLTLRIEVPTDSRYSTDDEQAVFYRQVVAEMEALPGVDAVGISEILPLDNAVRRTAFRIPTGAAADTALGADYNIAGAGFFEALAIPLVRGRSFHDGDDRDSARVALIDTTFAERHFPGEEPIGQLLEIWGAPHEIVGLVGAVRSAGLDENPRPTMYAHYLQAPDNAMSFVLRTRGNPEGLTEAAKEAVWNVDPEQPVFDIRRMDAVMAQGTSSRRMTLQLLGVFGALAVTMAALGVYGVMSYAVGQRTHELGLRQALGASARTVLSMVVREALRVTLAGITLGVLGAAVVVRALSSLLYGVGVAQPAAFLVVAVLLVLVAVVASLVPARRAAGVEPMAALRIE